MESFPKLDLSDWGVLRGLLNRVRQHVLRDEEEVRDALDIFREWVIEEDERQKQIWRENNQQGDTAPACGNELDLD
jgi:hypothetical protein